MALVTIQRSPSPSTDPDLDGLDSSEDASDSKSQLRKSLSESYFTVKGAALILPHTECTRKSTKKSHGGEIQSHLQSMLHLLRPEDSIKIAVRLEDTSQYQCYMALVSTRGRQDTEEAVILGIDCTSTTASIGLVLPMWMGLRIKLGGDGGFSLCTDEQSYLFKPVSVQAMWSAIQSLYKVLRIAEEMKYIPDGLTHTWIGYYRSRIDNSARMCQWNVEGVEIYAPSSLQIKANDGDSERIKVIISQTLKAVMMTVDLDEATSVMLRNAVEQTMDMSLTAYKSYFDEEIMRIVGQMDKPSEILDFLYLGSEWNASNLEELLEKGIGYILNVTKEIDNFFEGKFQYYNVRVYDFDESDLLKHWDKTYKFISKARSHNSKVLVHCKMGVSRSASTVMAFIMKDQRLTVDEAFQFVKERRSCVHPNSGFMEQLRTYEGILTASNKRDIFRCKSEQNLLDENTKEDMEPSQGFILGDSLFRMMSHTDWQSATRSLTCEEELLSSLMHKDDLYNLDILPMETDLETAESRSADSTEDALLDLPSSTQEALSIECAPKTTMTSMTTAPLPIAQSSHGISAQDREMIQEQEATSDAESYTGCLSSSEGSSSLQFRMSLGVLGPRIKPDSSWIKLETTEIDKGDSCCDILPFVDAVPCDNFHSGCQTNMCLLGAAKSGGALLSKWDIFKPATVASVEPKTASPAAVSFSSLLAGNLSPDKSTPEVTGSGVHFYIGNIQNILDVKPVTNENSSLLSQQQTLCSTFSSPCTNKISFAQKKLPESSDSSDYSPSLETKANTVKQKAIEHISQWTLAKIQQKESFEKTPKCSDTIAKTPEEDPKVQEVISSNLISTKNSHSRIELGVRQYFLREKIPWKPGRVRKIQEDINKTGQISQDEDTEDDISMKDSLTEVSTFQDASDEHTLLEQMSQHQPTVSLCQSHSCMELCSTEERDPTTISLYEREEIPLTAGTVLRTRLEIEERQRLFCGEGDQNLFDSLRPVVRSSSLKQERGMSRSRYTDNRRLTCGPIMTLRTGKSLDDLQSLGACHKRLDTLDSEELLRPGQRAVTNEELYDNSEIMEENSVAPHSVKLEEPPIEVGLVRKHKMELESKCETDKNQLSRTVQSSTSPSTNKSSFVSLAVVQSLLPQDVSRGSFTDTERMIKDTETRWVDSQSLSSQQEANETSNSEILTQEIDSSLLMNLSPPKDTENIDEPCANMVKYFVRKIEKQAEVSSAPRNVGSCSIDHEMKKATSPDKKCTKTRSLSLNENVGHSGLPLASQNTATPKKAAKPLDFLSLSAATSTGSCVGFSSPIANVQLESCPDGVCRSNTENKFFGTETGSKTSSRMNLDLKTSRLSWLLPEISNQTLDNVKNISFSSHVDKVQEPSASWTETAQSETTSSLRSPSHVFGQELLEPSVVKHLVGRFENKSPETEKSSSEFYNYIPKQREPSSSSPSVPLSHPYMEDSSMQNLTLSSQSLFRSVDNLSTHPFSVSFNPMLISSAFCSFSAPSPLLSHCRKHASLDSAQNRPDSRKIKYPLTFELAVEPYEQPTNSDACSLKESTPSPSNFPVRKLGPIPFNRKIMEGTEKKAWRSVRPRSADHIQNLLPYSDTERTSTGTLQISKTKNISDSFPSIDDNSDSISFPSADKDDDVSLWQVSDKGRKIRRLHSNHNSEMSEHHCGQGPFFGGSTYLH